MERVADTRRREPDDGRTWAEDEFDGGRLVHLMPEVRWPVKWAYYAVASQKALRRQEAAAFHNWLADGHVSR